MENSQIDRLIPSSPITLTDDPIHKDLDIWSNDLLRKLEHELQSDETDRLNICACLNQAALISSLTGKLSEARNLCQLQINWLSGEIKEKGIDIDLFLAILQPWINLGRLNHIEGKYAQAITHANMAEKAFQGKDLAIGEIIIAGDLLATFLADPEKGEALKNYLFINQIEGMIKIFVGSGNYLEGLAFIEEQQSKPRVHVEFLLEECELILLLKLGSYKEAWKRSQQFKPRNPFKKLLLLYYSSLTALMSGKDEYARKLTLKLANYLTKIASEKSFANLKRMLLYTSRLCAGMGLGQSAHALNEKGFNLSQSLYDQRYTINFGMGLSESNMIPEEEKKAILKTLQNHISISHYRIGGTGGFSPKNEGKPKENLERLKQFIQFRFAA